MREYWNCNCTADGMDPDQMVAVALELLAKKFSL